MQELNMIVDSLRALLHEVGVFLPRLGTAMIVLLIGWLFAKGARLAVVKSLRALNFHVLSERAGIDGFLQQGGTEKDTTDLFGTIAYLLVILASLIVASNSLGLAQVTDLLGKVLLFVPKLLVALLVLVFGSYFARFAGRSVQTYCRGADITDAELLGRLMQYGVMAFVVLLAMSVVVSFRVVGTLLVFGFLVAPPATAVLVVRRLPRTMVAAVGFAWLLRPMLATAAWPQAPKGARNVLVVVVDTWRADHAGFLGYERATTPELDDLVASGVVFERAQAQAGWTKPSVATLLTGLMPSRHHAISQPVLGLPVRGTNLPSSATTLIEVLRGIRSRAIRVVTADTRVPSPFASALLFSYVGNFIYEGDAPLAELRAQALTVDLARLREILGQADLRELLDPDAVSVLERRLQCLDPDRRARHADAVHDLLLRLGDLALDPGRRHDRRAEAARRGPHDRALGVHLRC